MCLFKKKEKPYTLRYCHLCEAIIGDGKLCPRCVNEAVKTWARAGGGD